MSASSLPFRFFDPEEDYLVTARHLPHWAQAGTVSFITWRTWDSMPRHVIEAWLADRNAWLIRNRINPDAPDWEARVERLPRKEQLAFRNRIAARWQDHLDDCHGACVLRRPELGGIVANSLKHFDGDRYTLCDFVVMPNHVHLLVVFPDSEAMVKQCYSWKHFTGVQLNRALDRRGAFWETDSFDHLVRSVEQFEYLRQYVAENPKRARLGPGEYIHFSREVCGE